MDDTVPYVLLALVWLVVAVLILAPRIAVVIGLGLAAVLFALAERIAPSARVSGARMRLRGKLLKYRNNGDGR